MPAVARLEGPVRQIIKKQAEGDPHHQGRGKPAVEDEAEEIKLPGRQHNAEEHAPSDAPFQQLMVTPEPVAEEKEFVIKEARCD